jgi:chemotaxis protein CheX
MNESTKAISSSPSTSEVEGWLLLLMVSVQEVFQTMLGTRVAPVFAPSRALRLEWTAMIGLTGGLRGVLMFSCDEKTATRIESQMLRVPVESAGERTADAVGEICNMIAGNFKHKVSGLSDNCSLCPPCVVTGKDYRLHRRESGALQSLPITFAFAGAPIYISLEVQE